MSAPKQSVHKQSWETEIVINNQSAGQWYQMVSKDQIEITNKPKNKQKKNQDNSGKDGSIFYNGV